MTGRVWATIKDNKLDGINLFIIQPMDEKLNIYGNEIVALDTVGSREEDLVYWVGGGEATLVYKDRQVPSDASIVGLVDRIDLPRAD